ncbi:MAG TPA: dihydroorotase [Solirubrobacteraceae bacterium]|nr:dihydroorotase [Solirubrobacteraceae bacterium]
MPCTESLRRERSMSPPALIRSPRTPANLLLREVRALDPRLGLDGCRDVLVRDGVIAEIAAPGTLAEEARAGMQTVEGGGRLALVPAFFDPHVHLRTPGQEHKEDIVSGTRAAAAGGYGGVIAMPNTDPPIDTPQRLRAVRETAAREAVVPVGFLPAITRGLAGEELTEMAGLREGGALGFTDDGQPVASAGVLREAIARQREVGGVLALHEEERSLSRGGALREGPVSAALGIQGVPAASEAAMVARDMALAACEGGRLHLQHLSCVASIESVAAAKACGVGVSAEATPHHLLLSEDDVRDPASGEADTARKMNPPLGTEADRRALVEALRTGTVDCVATDHAPHAAAEKALPFGRAPMGTTGLETAFAALHTGLVLPGVLDLATLLQRMTAGAQLFGLPEPTLATGGEASLTLVDLDAEWVAGEHGWESRSASNCFAGRRLRGRVLATIAAGALVYQAASLTAAVAA